MQHQQRIKVTHSHCDVLLLSTGARGGHCDLPNASEILFGKDDGEQYLDKYMVWRVKTGRKCNYTCMNYCEDILRQ